MGKIYKLTNGGGGAEPTGKYVGTITNGGAFPTTRLDGTPLQNEDFVVPLFDSEFPFIIDGVTFTNSKDKALYYDGTWALFPGALQDTQETPVKNKNEEGIVGTEGTQADVNKSVKSYVNDIYVADFEKRAKYLYYVKFDRLPEYIEDPNLYLGGGCSTFIRDGKMHRSLDYTYDNTADFIVETDDFVATSRILGFEDGGLTKKAVYQLPYHIVDGRNNSGIMVSTHIVYNDFGYAPSGVNMITLVPYYILSNLKSMNDINSIQSYLDNLKLPQSLISIEQTLHFMVSDGVKTCIISPNSSGSMVITDISHSEVPKLTNFRWYTDGVVSLTDGAMQNRPSGVERFNLINQNTKLEDLRFTKAYEEPTRLSEFIGIDGTTKSSSESQLMLIYNRAKAKYESRERNGETWQTVHAVVYGQKGMEELYIQEDYTINYADRIVYEYKEQELFNKIIDCGEY